MWLILSLVGALTLRAQTAQTAVVTPQDFGARVRQEMEASLAKQRDAVKKQAAVARGGEAPAAESSFFTVAWPRLGTTGAPNLNVAEPECDPMAKEAASDLIEQSARKEGLAATLLRAVIGKESAFRPCAVSPKGAVGLMQLMPATIEQFHVADPLDPKQNVEAGARLLKQLLTRYKDNVALALGAYNAGAERVDRDGGVPQIPETVEYVNDILKQQEILARP